jgi:hypothetical protein
MSHLNLETIARLVEDEPDPWEAAHLASCTDCRTQLDAMIEDVHALAMLPDMAAAPDDWDALERRLASEGLIRTPARRPGGSAQMMQVAAALVLFLGGAMAGRMSAAPTTGTTTATTDTPAQNDGSIRPSADAPVATLASEPAMQSNGIQPDGSIPGGTARNGMAENGTVPQDLPQPRRDVTLASNGSTFTPGPRSMDDAAEFLRTAEALYVEALTRYAEMASQSESGDPVARLAALTSIIMTTQAALNETPTDPVINGYHLTALAQREATLRQVALAGEPIY